MSANPSINDSLVNNLLDQVLVAVVKPASPPWSRIIDSYFVKLRRGRDADHRAAAEQRIWEVWCAHDDSDATLAMTKVLQALSVNDLATSSEQLDTMVKRWPDWAEAWNKRATLRFVQEHYDESLADILRTLELEPRHFGAISGFGQICLRLQDPQSAMIAFEQALNINPNLTAIKDTIEMLKKDVVHNVH